MIFNFFTLFSTATLSSTSPVMKRLLGSQRNYFRYPKVTLKQIKELKQLIKSSGNSGGSSNSLLVLEGHRTIIDALQSNTIQPVSLYVTESGFKTPSGIKLLSLCQKMSSVYSIDSEILSKLSTVETSQGVIGIFKKPEIDLQDLRDTLVNSPSSLILICDRIRDPGNLGSIIRSGYCFGVDLVVAVETCDVWSPKVLRSSMAYGMRYPVLSSQWSDVPSLLSSFSNLSNEFQVLITDCDPTSSNGNTQDKTKETFHNYYEVNYKNKATIVVIGSEATGVGIEAREDIVWPTQPRYIHIPMTRVDSESLNVAAATAVILGEAQRQRLT